MRQVLGITVLRWLGRIAKPSRGCTTPLYDETKRIVARGKRWFLVHWVPRKGYRVTSYGLPGLPDGVLTPLWTHDGNRAMIKRRQPPQKGQPAIPLAGDSVILELCPLLRQFLTHTAYEDMSPRTPGYFTIRTRGLAFELTCYDPDSGMRLACSGPSIDDMFSACELLLGAEHAPWTTDNYLTDQLMKKQTKKK